jgi:chromosome segregation ATPase
MSATDGSAGGVRRRVGRAVRGWSEESTALAAHERRLGEVERDLARIGPQVAALERRLEDVREALDVPTALSHEAAEAQSLIEEVRREHERIRARVSAAARFEERLARLEEEVAQRRNG